MKKYLIVGGAGYIGGYVVDCLLDHNHEQTIAVYDNLLFEDRYLKPIKNFIHGDIRDYAKLQRVIDEFKPTHIIWLAAIVGDGACQVDLELTKTLNEDCVKWLTDSPYKGRIIFTSTCSVYGINHDKNIEEDANPNPQSAYASTKLEAEQYLIKKRPESTVFRLGTLYGVGDTYSRLRFDLVANVLTLKAFLKENITVFGGEQWRPLLHVKDVGEAIMWTILHDPLSGIYNLTDHNYSITSLASQIKSITNSASIITQTDLKFEDMRNYHVSNKKLKATGWNPIHNLFQGISELYEILRENRIRNPRDSVYSNEAHMKLLIK